MAKKKQSSIASTFEAWMGLPMGRRVAIAIIILVGALVVLTLLRFALYNGMRDMQHTVGVSSYETNSRMMVGYDGVAASKSYGDFAEADMVMSESAYAPSMVPTPSGGGTGVYNESAYETNSYDAYIKTPQYRETCDAIEAWKPFEYVVFEHSQRSERSCTYRFKTTRAYTSAILSAIDALEPEHISVESEVVKKQMVRYSGELSILLRKEALLEDMLVSSVKAYDELVVLSKEAQDVETLSKVLDSKLAKIERLTREQVSLSAQLQSLTRRMTELEDRVEFDYFSVRIDKFEIVDHDAMTDSWVYAMQEFARDVNQMFQQLTLGVLLQLLVLAQIILYLLVLLVVVKYGWYAAKRFWKS